MTVGTHPQRREASPHSVEARCW